MRIRDLLENILIINLDKDRDRWENIQNQIPNENTNIIRILAVYGKELPNVEERMEELNSGSNKASAIGCGLSHRKAWQYVIDNSLPYALIMEDDINYAGKNLDVNYEKLTEPELPIDWDIIFLSHAKSNLIGNKCTRLPQYTDSKYNQDWYKFTDETPCGTWAYAVTNKTAQFLLNTYPDRPIKDAVDTHINNLMIDGKIQGYGSVANLFLHCYDYGSYTQNDGISPMLKLFGANPVLIITILLFLLCMLLGMKHRVFWVFGIPLLMYIIFRSRAISRVNRIVESNTVYKNLPGVYGIHPFDAFGNTWTEDLLEKSRELLRYLTNLGNKHGFKLYPAYGTLLGWARHNKKVIPYDTDIDCMCEGKYSDAIMNSLRKDLNIIIAENNPNYNVKISMKNGYPIDGYPYTYPFIDLFYYNIVPSEKNKLAVYIPIMREKIHLPSFTPVLTEFEGVPLYVPMEYKEFLTFWFGPDYMERCVSSDHEHRTEYPIDPRYKLDVPCKLLGL